ncbi:hypothetical protein KEJ37_01895 [Candidatus Bathyarchaeota archaeon]|nr:hypothetical protein [Candidatus Bathyarchaeota archaeon]
MPEEKTFSKIPLVYRVILKVPKLSIEGFPPEWQGIFWAVGLPLFVVGIFWLNFVLLVFSEFPINYTLSGVMNLAILLFIARILVERKLKLEGALLNEKGFNWDVDQKAHEYIELLKKWRSKSQKESGES